MSDSDSNTVMITQHKYLTTHDNSGGMTPEQVISLLSTEKMWIRLRHEGRSHADSHADRSGIACRLLPNQHSAGDENRIKQTERNKKTTPLRWISFEVFHFVLGVTSAARWHVH